MTSQDTHIHTDHNDLTIKEQPDVKTVHISIAGTPHRLVCPNDQVQALENAANKINEKIRDIRRAIKRKHPNNEELLVLTCLDLYDQVQTLTQQIQTHTQQTNQAIALIEKINKDARAVIR